MRLSENFDVLWRILEGPHLKIVATSMLSLRRQNLCNILRVIVTANATHVKP